MVQNIDCDEHRIVCYSQDLTAVSERTPHQEVKLVLLRFLSVLLSRTKAGTKPSNEVGTSTCKPLLSLNEVESKHFH